jgi:hypothetical protein
MSFEDPKASGSRGKKRMQELGAEMKVAIATNVEAILASLGRPASGLERAQAELFCGLLLRAARLRDQGRNDLEVLREVGLLLQNIPWLRGPQPVAASRPIAPTA